MPAHSATSVNDACPDSPEDQEFPLSDQVAAEQEVTRRRINELNCYARALQKAKHSNDPRELDLVLDKGIALEQRMMDRSWCRNYQPRQ